MSDPATPPKGDFHKAEKYITQLSSLLRDNRLEVTKTDLNKFDPGSFQDHYRIDLKDYQIEVSHSKLGGNGKDSYVMLFTNFKNVADGSCTSVILGYIHLTDNQYHRFRTLAEEQLETKRRAIEEKRFKDALAPLDILLEDIETNRKPEPVTHFEPATAPEPLIVTPSHHQVPEHSFWEQPKVETQPSHSSEDDDFIFSPTIHQS